MEPENEQVEKEEEKGDPNSRLLIAAEDGNVEALVAAIGEGADIHTIDPSNKHDALAMAAIQGNEECLRALLVAGANIEKDNEQTALHLAARMGRPNCVRTLLEFRADADAVAPDGWTALHKAAYWGNAECIRELVRGGCQLGSATNEGFTATHLAAITDRASCIEVLCDSGVNFNEVTAEGATAVHIAASWGNLATIKVITEHPKKLREGVITALKCSFKQDEIARLLLVLLVGPNADLSLQDHAGKCAIEVAVQKRQMKVVDYLTSYCEESQT